MKFFVVTIFIVSCMVAFSAAGSRSGSGSGSSDGCDEIDCVDCCLGCGDCGITCPDNSACKNNLGVLAEAVCILVGILQTVLGLLNISCLFSCDLVNQSCVTDCNPITCVTAINDLIGSIIAKLPLP
ncbi:hypothetical protein DMENIID0001_133540 [Sergentomyia squamirostris]